MNLMIPVALFALRIHLYPRESKFARCVEHASCAQMIRLALGRSAATNMIILIRESRTFSLSYDFIGNADHSRDIKHTMIPIRHVNLNIEWNCLRKEEHS